MFFETKLSTAPRERRDFENCNLKSRRSRTAVGTTKRNSARGQRGGRFATKRLLNPPPGPVAVGDSQRMHNTVSMVVVAT